MMTMDDNARMTAITNDDNGEMETIRRLLQEAGKL